MKLKFLIMFLLMAGCAGSSAKPDQAAEVSEPPVDAKASNPPAGPDIVSNAVQPRATREVAADVIEEGQPVVQRAQVESFMRRGPAFALTQVAVDPVHGTSGFEGYKIASLTPSVADFLQTHLQQGDVLTHLNGIKIERPDDYLQAWNRLKEAPVLSIDYVRDGQKMSARWQVQ